MRKIKSLQKVPYFAPDVAVKQVPAPVAGWDAISALSNMPNDRAPILINWVPRTAYVELRAGYAPWAQGITEEVVETLMVYRSPSGQTMFAASGGSIFDVSTQLQTTYTEVVSGLSSDRWQSVNFTPAGAATVLQCVNGSDSMEQWNGTAWSTPSITGLPGSHTTADFVNIAIFKRRLWYVIQDSTIAVFMPTDAISGAIGGYLDVGALLSKGGYLLAIADWTVDGGSGPDDFLALVSSEGQAVIYQGTDPTDATQWLLTGVFDIAKPLGSRCITSIGSDLAIITLMGILPISQSLPFDPAADRSVAITARIQNAMAQSAMLGQDLFGWQLISFPLQSLLILNVPQVEGVTQVQYVSNLLNGAWCQFQGWNANCFAVFNEELYWGDNNGNVNHGYVGGSDFNSPILCDMQCAFNYFEDPGRTKRMTMIQPFLVGSGVPNLSLSVDADFVTTPVATPIPSVISSGALWDQAIWDQSLWPLNDGNVPDKRVYSVTSNDAHCLAVRMVANVAPIIPNSTFDSGQFDYMQFDGVQSAAVTLQANMFNVTIEMGGPI